MKKLFIFLILFNLSCTDSGNTDKTIVETKQNNDVINNAFQAILDSANVDGSILILQDNTFYSNDYDWAKKGRLPASTFKIPNSIIALDLGLIQDDSTMIFWDGKPRYQKRWEADLHFRDAFHYSCVPCYQDIARKIGNERMNSYLSKINYGEMVFDTTNLDMFWLEGASRISQYQQIDFLQRFNRQQLPIEKTTYSVMSRMMIIEQNEKYILRGKTGWSVENDKDNCWFVGYVKLENETCYFATNVEPKPETNLNDLASIRQEVTYKALKLLGVLSKK